jgi:hypothetical protein
MFDRIFRCFRAPIDEEAPATPKGKRPAVEIVHYPSRLEGGRGPEWRFNVEVPTTTGPVRSVLPPLRVEERRPAVEVVRVASRLEGGAGPDLRFNVEVPTTTRRQRSALPPLRDRKIVQRSAFAKHLGGRWTAEQYMSLQIEGRSELLGGVIRNVPTKTEAHRFAVNALAEALILAFVGTPRAVRIRDPLAVAGHDAPEVDVAVVARQAYKTAPTAADALALIEVADTTYGGEYGDRTYKIPLYVDVGVPAWVVNLPLRQVEFYGSPADLETPHGRVFTEADTLDVLGVAIPVASLFEGPCGA